MSIITDRLVNGDSTSFDLADFSICSRYLFESEHYRGNSILMYIYHENVINFNEVPCVCLQQIAHFAQGSSEINNERSRNK